jgi:hypothetical protein
MISYNGATASGRTLLNPTSDAPPSEALILAALIVMLSCVLFSTFLAGPDPSWEEDEVEAEKRTLSVLVEPQHSQDGDSLSRPD